jgi:hypothetical protein
MEGQSLHRSQDRQTHEIQQLAPSASSPQQQAVAPTLRSLHCFPQRGGRDSPRIKHGGRGPPDRRDHPAAEEGRPLRPGLRARCVRHRLHCGPQAPADALHCGGKCSARPTFPLLPLRSPRRGRGCSRTPARPRRGPCTKLLPKALSAPPARAALAATCARTAGPQVAGAS